MFSFLRAAVTACFVLLGFNSFSQDIFNFNSADVIKKGDEFYNKGKYKEATAEYLKVSRNDTNYQEVLRDLTLVYYADSNYKASNAAAALGLKYFPDKADDWYNLMANALDGMGEQQKAIAMYDSVIARYNFAFLPWFNKAITYSNSKQYAEAKKCLQQAALINPYYSPIHYQLGIIAIEEGDLVSAMLSFTTNLLMNPENKYASNSVNFLSAIAKMKDDVAKKAAAKKVQLPESFEIIQEIISSKAALDPKYKLKVKLEDPIVRQLQVVMEKLDYDKGNKSFTMQYYVPFYQQLYNSQHLEPFIYYLFSGLDIKDINTYVKKNQKEINAFTSVATAYFNDIRETRLLNPEDRKKQEVRYLFSNGKLKGKGKIEGVGDKATITGFWELYSAEGRLLSKGNFDDKGQKTGTWDFYHANGKLKERSNYKLDKGEGHGTAWFENGQVATEYDFKDGEYEGMFRQNYYNGLTKFTCRYKAGKKDGLETGYKSTGVKYYTTDYKDGLQDGAETFFHPNGKVSSAVTYKAGKAEGPFKSYYVNGSKYMEGAFADDKRSGQWKEYFNDGKTKALYSYNAGDMEGDYVVYHNNGKPMIKTTYAKNKIDGTYEDFAINGKLFSTSVFEKGKLKELKFYDKSDKMISNANIRNGGGNLVYYDVNGKKTSEGSFTKEGSRNGKTTWYYPDGKISATANYKEGSLEGEKINFYRNGQVSSKINYADDEENGYKVYYYINGNKQYEGKMVNGNPDGIHIQYNMLGEVDSKTNYYNNEVHGFTEYFHPNGKPDYEQYFSYGWIENMKQFDTTGKEITDADITTGSGPYLLKKYNGNSYVTGSYQHHYLNGTNKTMFDDKYTSSTFNYKHGTLDSTMKVYYYGNKLSHEGQYKMGERDGKWNYYFDDGKLYYTETYDNGRLNGVTKLLNEDGWLEKEINYKENEVDGEYKLYGENGMLALLVNYEEGKIVSYTYEGKDGKLLPLIPVNDEPVNVTAYFRNGVKSAEFTLEQGEYNGPRKLYFTNGKPFVEGVRVWGLDHGMKKVYRPDGSLQKEQPNFYDNIHGLAKTYYANGKVSAEEIYYNGELHGASKYYDAAGKLTETRNYYYGSLQSVTK